MRISGSSAGVPSQNFVNEPLTILKIQAMKYLLFILIFTSCSIFSTAQTGNEKTDRTPLDKQNLPYGELPDTTSGELNLEIQNLMLEGRHYGDSVVLRWAAGKQRLWRRWSKCGYQIQRLKIGQDTTFYKTQTFEAIGPDTIKPLPLADWEPLIQRDSTYVLVAAECLYGEMSANLDSSSMDLKALAAVAEEAFLRYGLAMFSADMSAKAATALGLRYSDRNIEKGAHYLYRLFPAPNCTDISTGDTAYFYAEYSDHFEPLHPPVLKGEGYSDYLEISWDILKGEAPMTGYFLERKAPGEKRFTRVRNEPFVYSKADNLQNIEDAYLFYIDSVPKKFLDYEYRMSGIDLFADKTVYSNVVKERTRDLNAPAAPRFIGITSLDNKYILLEWEKREREKDMRGYIIERSITYEGPYELMTPEIMDPVVNRYVDTSQVAILPHFYRVAAVDTAGNTAFSPPGYGFVKDTLPPEKPVDLEGYMDSLGTVHLAWKSNAEWDLLGYRVFLSNASEYEFQNATGAPIADTTFEFKSTLNTLTKHMYAYVVSVDMQFHHSTHSDTIRINRPDTLKPTAPIISDLKPSPEGMKILFFESSSKDVAHHFIYRKESTAEGLWQVLDSLNSLQAASGNYADTTSVEKLKYSYYMMAIDSSGNRSENSPVFSGTWFENKAHLPPKITEAFWDEENKEVMLRFEPAEDEPLSHYILYKNMDGQIPKTYKSIESDKLSYTDSRIEKKGTYYYAIQAIAADGERSELSAWSMVVIK